MISGIYTAILLVIFIGIIVWAWSDKRKAEFEHLSNLPLEDDINEIKGDENGHE
jgi:cytochrome c oxidase cbb3-type subunit 4